MTDRVELFLARRPMFPWFGIYRMFAPILVALLAIGGNAVIAAPNVVINLPITGRKIVNGVTMNIDCRWVSGSGYRPIRITVNTSPALPAKSSRDFEVDLDFYGQRGGSQTPRVRAMVTLPAGATTATTTIPVPHNDDWYVVGVDVRENGRTLTDLSQSHMGLGGYSNSRSEAVPSFLIVHNNATSLRLRTGISAPGFGVPLGGMSAVAAPSAEEAAKRLLPDIRKIYSIVQTMDPFQSQRIALAPNAETSDAEILNILNSTGWIELVPPSDLVEEWIGLSSVQFIFLFRDTLDAITPEAKVALRDWTRAGGILCITDAGTDFARLPELETFIEASPLVDDEKADGPGGWSLPDRAQYGDVRNRLRGVTRSVATTASPASGSVSTVPNLPTPPTPPETNTVVNEPPKDPPFAFRTVGFGYLVAFPTMDPFEKSADLMWDWFLVTIPENNWMWFRHHGVSQLRDNREFGNWMVPGVGRAPVVGFLVLISLFMIVVGPVNHFVLSRRRKVILLMVTVPVCAAIVTCGLFAYAVIHDGLATRSRVRSFTYIDQRGGWAVSQSRQSYYAAIAPSLGVQYPRDSTVYLVEHSQRWPYARQPSPYRVTMGDLQAFDRGYVSSRTIAQFMVTRSNETDSRLDVAPATAETKLAVKNHLGTDLIHLFVCDESGKFHSGKAIAAGEGCELEPIDREGATDILEPIIRLNNPTYPDGYDPEKISASPWFDAYRWQNWDTNYPAPTIRYSVMERRIRAALLAEAKNNWRRRTYIAITQSSPEVPTGIDHAQEQASLHVIEGSW